MTTGPGGACCGLHGPVLAGRQQANMLLAHQALAPDLVLAGISSNPVYALDLAFFLPLCAAAGIGLLRRTGAAGYALPMLIWVPLMGAGVLGGFVLAAAAGDAVPIAVVSVIGALCVVSASLAAISIVRPSSPLAGRTHRAEGASRPAHPGG